MALESKNPRDLAAHLSRNLLPALDNLPPKSGASLSPQYLITQFTESCSSLVVSKAALSETGDVSLTGFDGAHLKNHSAVHQPQPEIPPRRECSKKRKFLDSETMSSWKPS